MSAALQTNNQDYCRLCSTQTPIMYLKTNDDIKNLNYVILKHLDVHLMSNEDNLPTRACTECCNSILRFHNFFNRVQDAQKRLRWLCKPLELIKSNLKISTSNNEYESTSKLNSEEPNLKSDWKCYKCDKMFWRRFDLEKHFTVVHESQAEYMCTECKALFTIYNEYVDHIKEHPTGNFGAGRRRKVKSSMCEICKKYYRNSTNLRKHMRIHLGIKPFECDVCEKKFRSKQHMQIHRNTVCTQKPDNIIINEDSALSVNKRKTYKWQCLKCNLFLQSAKHLEEHFLKVHNEKKTFVSVEEGVRVFKCQVCSKDFKNSTNLHHHMFLHTGEKKFVCDVCGKKCTMKQQLIAHKICHDKSKLENYACQYCDRKFASAANLACHAKFAHLEQKFECTICCKKFVGEEGLASHQEWHKQQTEEAYIICDQCGKVLKSKLHLASHAQMHSKNVFQCEQCPKIYKSVSGLKSHKRFVHSTERPHGCPSCPKQFHSRDRLNKHLKIHTTSYRMLCPHCNKKFVKKENLQIHLRQHAGEKPFSCLECSINFMLRKSFVHHLREKHAVNNFASYATTYPKMEQQMSVINNLI